MIVAVYMTVSVVVKVVTDYLIDILKDRIVMFNASEILKTPGKKI